MCEPQEGKAVLPVNEVGPWKIFNPHEGEQSQYHTPGEDDDNSAHCSSIRQIRAPADQAHAQHLSVCL